MRKAVGKYCVVDQSKLNVFLEKICSEIMRFYQTGVTFNSIFKWCIYDLFENFRPIAENTDSVLLQGHY